MGRGVFLGTLGLFVMLACSAFAAGFGSPSQGIDSIRYEGGLLSLETTDAPLEQVLARVSKLAGITVISDGPLEGRLTVHIVRLPLDKAMRKLLRGKDTSFLYRPAPKGAPGTYVLKEVRIYADKAGIPSSFGRTRGVAPPTALPRSSRPRARPPGRRMSTETARSPFPKVPEFSQPDAQEIISDLMEGRLEDLSEIADRFKKANPQVEEQIDEYLDSLEEARKRAEESGRPIPPLEGIGNMQMLMQQIMKSRSRLPGEEAEQ